MKKSFIDFGVAFLTLAALVFLMGGMEIWAQAYRNDVGVPPVEVYQSMLHFVERKEYKKITTSLKILSPIVNHVTAKFTDNPSDGIIRAIDRNNSDDILLSVQTLIILDIKDLLEEAFVQLDSSPESSRTQVKSARLNYELLSPYVQKKDTAIDQKIRNNFARSLQVLIMDPKTGTQGKPSDMDSIRRLWIEIVFNLAKIFPPQMP